MTTKPLYLLIKLDVDGEIVFDYKDASNYANNFCNNMEFELIDHCLEEEENNDLFIGCDPEGNPLGKEEEPMFTLNEEDWV
jgi:nanoRNase/pAp phosphatase (c-di-AMP/oligoRNAs hydrolase)